MNAGAGTLSNGTPLTAAASANLNVACGNDANPFRPFQGYGGINRIETTANSIYNALQVSVRRTVGAFNLSLAYTYSHSIDDSSDRSDTTFVDSYDPGRTRASSNFDVRHNLVASYVYSVPFFRGTGFARTALGGWQVSGITTIQSGTPVTVTNGTAFGDNAGVGNGLGAGSFPDLVGDPAERLRQQSAQQEQVLPGRSSTARCLCPADRPHVRRFGKKHLESAASSEL